jgi:predicted amidohydrolase YtcJ
MALKTWVNCIAALGLQAMAVVLPAGAAPADLVLTHARIYTAAGPAVAETLAARNGEIVYVGDAAGLKDYLGPRTRRVDAGGRLVLPGLVDSHIHPIDLVSGDECDLRSAPRSLREISTFIRGCIRHFHPPAGSWLRVQGWSVSYGNKPDVEYPTLRVALDKAAPKNPVYMMGDDGHHAAFNSAAMALAINAQGRAGGVSRTTDNGQNRWRGSFG